MLVGGCLVVCLDRYLSSPSAWFPDGNVVFVSDECGLSARALAAVSMSDTFLPASVGLAGGPVDATSCAFAVRRLPLGLGTWLPSSFLCRKFREASRLHHEAFESVDPAGGLPRWVASNTTVEVGLEISFLKPAELAVVRLPAQFVR